MPDDKKSFDLEDVYDREVAPLMAKIIEVCKQHKLPMVASFLYANSTEDDQQDFCTTQLLFDDRPIPTEMWHMADSIYRPRGPALRMRVTKGDGSVEDTVILP